MHHVSFTVLFTYSCVFFTYSLTFFNITYSLIYSSSCFSLFMYLLQLGLCLNCYSTPTIFVRFLFVLNFCTHVLFTCLFSLFICLLFYFIRLSCTVYVCLNLYYTLDFTYCFSFSLFIYLVVRCLP